MLLKICSKCKVPKPYDPDAPHRRKASGFHSDICWECYAPDRNAYRQRYSQGKRRAKDIVHVAKGRARVALRKSEKLLRTPPWADLKRLAAIYQEAARLGKVVDHCIPLRGELVSGLHVHENLQLLTTSENASKGNLCTPADLQIEADMLTMRVWRANPQLCPWTAKMTGLCVG
jgi:hypothetical protein